LVDLDLRFLHNGLPRRERQAVWEAPKAAPSAARPTPSSAELGATLRWMLAHHNVCSREHVIRQYDHEVQAGTVIKPLQGLHHDGPGDATVIWPASATGDPASFRGFAVAHGLNPAYGKIDPYAMALSAVDEALSNLACVGADVSQAAILDNFCWGNPDDPAQLGRLVRAALGCHDAAIGYDAPFISGKDSFYNEYTAPDGKRFPIPGTLLISAIAPVPDVRKAITMDLKGPGNALYLVGWTSDETGGSLWAERLGQPLGAVPTPEPRSARDTLRSLSSAMRDGLVASAHNLSEGGLAVAASEMAFSGEVGVHIELDAVNRTKDVKDDAAVLFSESPSRFLLEVLPDNEKAFLRALKGSPVSRVGSTIANPVLRVAGLDGTTLLEEGLHELKDAWQHALPARLGLANGNGRK
jgi:phosphoribosylformylglycinamidine synthase